VKEAWDEADDMARFCLATQISPSEYMKLTGYQKQAFADELEEQAKEAKKRG